MNVPDLLLRLRAILQRRQMEGELDEEMQIHLDLQSAKYIAAGATVSEAQARARREFGALELAKENCRDERRVQTLETLLQDVRYAVRGLRRDWVLALITLFTLALCIGANTTVFSIVNAVMVRPLPYPSPARLYWITERMGRNRNEFTIGGDYYSIRHQNRVFSEVAAFSRRTLNLTGVENPEQLDAALVTPSFFQVFALKPLLGRTFTESEQGVNAPNAVVVSYPFWRSHLAADPHAIGQTLSLDGLPATVIGVMPQGFDYPKGTDTWQPTTMDERNELPKRIDRPMRIASMVARLKPNISETQLTTELSRLTLLNYRQFPADFATAGFLQGMVTLATPLQRQMVGDLRPALLVLTAAVGLLLLIACANLANLLLARATSRTRELAMRIALGSGRSRIVKQVLTESLVLALPGGAAGVIVSLLAITLLNAWKPLVLASYPPLTLDLTTLAFTAGLTFLTAVFFGMAPAWTAGQVQVQDALKSAAPAYTSSRLASRIRHLLVVAELAVTLLLLISAGLLSRSFVKLASVDLGFSADHLLTLHLNVTGSRYAQDDKRLQFFDDVLARVKLLPQVKDAAFATDPPLNGDGSYSAVQFEIEGHPLPMAQRPQAEITLISRDFFKTLKIPLRSGRLFGPHDTPQSRDKIVVNEAFAHRVFSSDSPLQQRILFGSREVDKWRIVGVVGDVRSGTLGAEPSPLIYRCLCQGGSTELPRNDLLVRTIADPERAIGPVVGQIRSVDRDEPVLDVRTMDQRFADALAPRRFYLLLIGTFTAFAIILSATGVFGVMAYLVAQRHREIGIRIAIGARRAHILNLVLGESLVLTVFGIAAGLIGAWQVTRYLHSMLYGIESLDSLTFVTMSLLLAAVAIFASLIPAVHAGRVDPLVALREN